MLCQMAENEGVALAGEAGVFHSLLPDNAPSGVGERLPPPLTSCQPGTNTFGENDKEKWDGLGIGGMNCADIVPAKTTRFRLVLRQTA